ncbi:DsbA family protein [Haloechinothrix sp. YIM 98757]|uniref:DsbA family protein n=1 Tax=Haloechinothrix aidingensis TaxID=2752311 RepID=A0A838A7K5_9PSEU|nr:DsbA family protein [Haloechinothrix aidingensis]MBA0125115.1 DsbA family protein [Haloechinothrix aidingensis]
MHDVDLEFFFDPVCPFCWVTAEWVRDVGRQRPLSVRWRPLSLRILNEPIGYETRPEGYPDAHQRGLEMLRVVAAVRQSRGPEAIGELYRAMGEAVWNAPAPPDATFEAVLAETARPRDLVAILDSVGLPAEFASAAEDGGWDEGLRAETEEAVERAGGGVGTPILSFDPPDGPALFGPVIDQVPSGDDALRLWDSVTTLARWPGFAELKRSVRAFPDTPLSAHLSGRATRVG